MFKLIYKPKGISSFKFIKKYSIENDIKKIGHTGTLDPLAQGLLLIATNDDTRLIEYIKADKKEYVAIGRFGILTSSLDLDGEIIKTNSKKINEEDLINILKSFVGEQLQMPPQISAKKINGERSYKLSRKNIYVHHDLVKIRIDKIQLIYFKGNDFKIDVIVSKGTYIRQLINDIATKLDTIATLIFLERTSISGLSLDKVDSEIKIGKILSIDFDDIKYISKDELILLSNGNEYKTHYDNKTLLIYNNKPLAIIKERRPIKVFPNNIIASYSL